MKSKLEIIGLGMFSLVLATAVIASMALMAGPVCEALLAILAFVY